MPLTCGLCSAEINSYPADLKLVPGTCECDGAIFTLVTSVCESCGKKIDYECYHMADSQFVSSVAKIASVKFNDMAGTQGNLTLQHLWKQLAYAADALDAYLIRDHEHPNLGLKETLFGQLAAGFEQMNSNLPPEMMAVMGQVLAMMTAMQGPPPPCRMEDEEAPRADASHESITTSAALVKCIDLGISPGARISKDLAKGDGIVELAAAARLVLVYSADTDDYAVENVLVTT